MRALDENGKSDPYVKIRVGKAVQESKVIDQELHPVWDETFVFPTKRAEACLLSAHPKIIFELWDKDFLSPDEFLGQASITCLLKHSGLLTCSILCNHCL